MQLRPLPLVLVPALAFCVLAVGCQRRDANKWSPPAEPASGEPAAVSTTATAEDGLVLFAPVASGPLAKAYADARLDFAYELSNRVDLLAKSDVDGKVGEHLPDSDSDEWTKGPVGATRGARLVVLTRILSITTDDGVVSPEGRVSRVTATVDLRALDAKGMQVFAKKAVSSTPTTSSSAKMMGDAHKPESQAAWQACSTAVGALISFIDQRNDNVVASSAPTEAGGLVLVQVDSEPTRADVIIDGVFKGTTPMQLTLPARNTAVRIERQGYQAWERTLVPTVGMRIQPALVGLPPGSVVAPTSATPAPALESTTGAAAAVQATPATNEDALLNPPTPAALEVPPAAKP